MADSLIGLALEQIDTTSFELWCQEVLTNNKGYHFEPTGGIHDGGQDGFIRALGGKVDHYIQISKEQNTSGKIRKTIQRIRKTRDVKKLIYVTSQNEPERDLIEAQLSHDLGVEVVIHDKRWLQIQAQIHENLKTSLFSYCKELVDDFSKLKNTERRLDISSRLSIVSYLEAHVRSIPGAENIQDVCLDTLIYNSLIDTDPDQNIFMSGSDIEASIKNNYPNVLKKADSSLESRLKFLSSKKNDPRIRKHPGDNYALPYSVRNKFDEENKRVVGSNDKFVDSLNSRLNELVVENTDKIRAYVVSCVHDAITETYQSQAMNFAASITNRSFEPDIRVYEIIKKLIQAMDVPIELREQVTEASTTIFRYVCYSSNEEEQQYLSLLLKYFTIQFVMDGNAAVSKYFSDMAAELRIYVGTDIIVRCLSEALVRESSKGMTNSLQLLESAGVCLRVTRQTVREVFSHIRLTTSVFRRDYEYWFHQAGLEQVKNCDRILIRAFCYAYFEPHKHTMKPRTWSNYLRNFGAAAWFSGPENEESIDQFGSYLVDKYNLEFVEIDQVIDKIDEDLAIKVAIEILEFRDFDSGPTDGNRILAMNDAQMGLFVNSERITHGEKISANLYGYNTWWLTEETAVIRALRKCNQSCDVVMHPQFMINYFILDPTFMKKNDRSLEKIMPSVFGLRITDRISPIEMRNFIQGIGDLAGLDEPAQRARIRHAANKMKRGKNYSGRTQTLT